MGMPSFILVNDVTSHAVLGHEKAVNLRLGMAINLGGQTEQASQNNSFMIGLSADEE